MPPPELKAAYVREMFAHISGRYDLMNRLMTLGRDRAWRRLYGRPGPPGTAPRRTAAGHGRVLDVATGTGDLSFEALRQRPGVRVVGLDFVPEMLVLAREKSARLAVEAPLLAGDALELPFRAGSFDAVVTAFALRNVTDIPAAFAEMARVTRPGGRVACLEIAKPRTPLFRRLFNLYFYRLVPVVGGWITGQRSAYTYLPHSLTGFPDPRRDRGRDAPHRLGRRRATAG